MLGMKFGSPEGLGSFNYRAASPASCTLSLIMTFCHINIFHPYFRDDGVTYLGLCEQGTLVLSLNVLTETAVPGTLWGIERTMVQGGTGRQAGSFTTMNSGCHPGRNLAVSRSL